MDLDKLEDISHNHELNTNDTNTSDNNNNAQDRHEGEENMYLSNICKLIESLDKKFDTIKITAKLNDSIRRHYLKFFHMLSEGKHEECMNYIKYYAADFSYQEDIVNCEIKYANTKMKKMEKALRAYSSNILSIIETISKDINILDSNGLSVLIDLQKLLNSDNVLLSVKNLLKRNKQIEDELCKHKIKMDVSEDLTSLRECNIKLQESENMLRIENSKLKKEVLILKNDLNGKAELIRKKGVTIDKQNNVINMLQKRFSEPKDDFPISEIKTKIEMLNKLLGKVKNDEKASSAINEEIRDLKKRLFDFNLLMQKEE